MSTPRPVRKATKKRKLEPTIIEQPESYSAVLQSHLNLLNQGRLSDVTFIVGERKERIPCHQLFLRARSSVFEVMFSERWNQDTAKEVLLEDVDPKTFRMFLQFIYADTFAANVPEALELLQVAHKYDVQLLVSKCERVLEGEITLNDAVAVFQAAQRYEKIQLLDKVGSLWAQSLSNLQTHPSFSKLDKETLMFVLNRTDLEMKEVDLFRLALQWAKNQKDATVEESLEDILPLIRFPIMTLNEFTAAVVPTNVLPSSTVIELFTYFGTDDKDRKSLARKLGFSTQQRQLQPQPKLENPIVFASLYSDQDIADETTIWQQLKAFKESMQFYSQVKWLGEDRQLARQERSLGFGLKSISVYCPTNATTTKQPGRSTTHFKGLKICLKSKDYRHRDIDLYNNRSYKNLFSWASFQVEQGKITDIQLDTSIPFKKDTIYCITIEETASAEGDVSAQGYNARDFQYNPCSSIDVDFDKDYILDTTLNVERNQLQGFVQDTHRLTRPHLISRLGFQEL